MHPKTYGLKRSVTIFFSYATHENEQSRSEKISQYENLIVEYLLYSEYFNIEKIINFKILK